MYVIWEDMYLCYKTPRYKKYISRGFLVIFKIVKVLV